MEPSNAASFTSWFIQLHLYPVLFKYKVIGHEEYITSITSQVINSFFVTVAPVVVPSILADSRYTHTHTYIYIIQTHTRARPPPPPPPHTQFIQSSISHFITVRLATAGQPPNGGGGISGLSFNSPYLFSRLFFYLFLSFFLPCWFSVNGRFFGHVFCWKFSNNFVKG